MIVLVVALVALGLAGCSRDGRELARPTRPAPSTTIAPPSTRRPTTAGGDLVGPAASPPRGVIVLSSPAIGEASEVPPQFTCDGAGTAPPLEWVGVPEDAAELVVTVTDPDAGGFVHWVLAGLAPQLRSIGGDQLPEGAVQARNSAGTLGWTPPCPPSGQHRYVFTIVALAGPSGITDGEDGAAAAATLAGAIARGSFTVTYQRP